VDALCEREAEAHGESEGVRVGVAVGGDDGPGEVAVLRLLAKASGLLDNPDNEDRPSVIGINVKAPEVIDEPK
jgi:hypothetical protein